MTEKKQARCIMVQGTMSGAGKSLLAAGLCRIFRQDGWKVAPFKSQNMALNSFVTAEGLEMGRAQVMQAEAAGIAPDVRMNPILLKPNSDTGSQVIVNGEIRGNMSARDYFATKTNLIPDIMEAYESLAEEYDIIVLEGAGSPAEINLKDADIVNMGMAEMVNAPVLLAGDIDRGGVFAQLFGTYALLEPAEQDRVIGFIINKFRGDASILEPGPSMLEEKTGVPVVGCVPYMRLDVDDEDSLAPRLSQKSHEKPIDIAVIRFPRISNFTDLAPLEASDVLGVRYVDRADELGNPDCIILPGTKSTTDDLLWMRQNGLEAVIQKAAALQTPVIGICGGYQMLGLTLRDPEHTEGTHEMLKGLGLLTIDTTFTGEKTRTQVEAVVESGIFAGAKIRGYEIHMGITENDGEPLCRVLNVIGQNYEREADETAEQPQTAGTADAAAGEEHTAGTMGAGRTEAVGEQTDHAAQTHREEHFDGCQEGLTFGTYLHGLFDSGEMTEKLADFLCARKGIARESAGPVSWQDHLQQQYDLLADALREALDMEKIYREMDSFAAGSRKRS